MAKNRIVVIGGVACGPKAAARARRRDPHADITIIERGELLSYAGCGLPYYIEGKIETADELMSAGAGVIRDAAFFKNVKAIDVMNRTLAERIDRKKKVVEVISVETGVKSEVAYDKLVLATGADSVMPPFAGIDLKGVFRLNHPTDAEDIKKWVTCGCNSAVIIGAGLIGMEVAEALTSNGISVTMIEMMDTLVPVFLDPELSAHLEKHIKGKGVNVMTGTKVLALEGDDTGQVSRVITDKGEVDTQMVLVAIGVRPNITLAKDAGLEIGETGAIKVNEHLQTNDPNIYAGGDCAQVWNRITGKPAYVPLGSTANKHGRIIGDNITGGNSTFDGVLGTVIFKAFDFNVGRVGLSEKDCIKMGLPYVTALTPGPDRAHYYPTSRPMILKLIADPKSGKVLGMQAVGTGDVAKRVDVTATLLSFGGTYRDVSELDLAYAPPFSSAVDILQHAANVIDNKINDLAHSITPMQVKNMIDGGRDFIWLDVRGPKEVETLSLKNPRVVNIPLGKLRARSGELPKDAEIVTFCKVSIRGYEAQRILDGEGFKNVKFMDGGVSAWPYSLEV
ncbi:FAD-dependent oxidoreductase [bacterium]|nr:FAD-dependent oxidoreductase [bacterium]